MALRAMYGEPLAGATAARDDGSRPGTCSAAALPIDLGRYYRGDYERAWKGPCGLQWRATSMRGSPLRWPLSVAYPRERLVAMLTALGIFGGALAAWQELPRHRLLAPQVDADARRTAPRSRDAILEDQKDMNWASAARMEEAGRAVPLCCARR